jgi:hypothetical protein
MVSQLHAEGALHSMKGVFWVAALLLLISEVAITGSPPAVNTITSFSIHQADNEVELLVLESG